jgi:ribosomal protein L24E
MEKAAISKAYAEKMEKIRLEKEKRKPAKLKWTYVHCASPSSQFSLLKE